MSRYEQPWCDALAAAVGDAPLAELAPLRVLYVVTDTEAGKQAFHVDLEGGAIGAATTGRLPRGQKADITITSKEPVFLDVWTGARTRDAAFMRGDLKIEGAYERWLDELVPLFDADPWAAAWRTAAGS